MGTALEIFISAMTSLQPKACQKRWRGLDVGEERTYLKLSTKRDVNVLTGVLQSLTVTGRGPASSAAPPESDCMRFHCVEVGVALVKPLASEMLVFPSTCAFCQRASKSCEAEGTSACSRSMNTASSARISWVNELNLRRVSTTSWLAIEME